MAIDGCAKAGEVRATAMTVASASRFMAFSTATGASFIANITLMEFRAQRPACGGQYAADRWPHIASILGERRASKTNARVGLRWCHLLLKSVCFSMCAGNTYWCHFSAKSLAISTNGLVRSESGLALPGHPKDSTPRYGRRTLPLGVSVQVV